jgi:hypothetical protein
LKQEESKGADDTNVRVLVTSFKTSGSGPEKSFSTSSSKVSKADQGRALLKQEENKAPMIPT